MKPIQLHITITPDDDSVTTFVEVLRRVCSSASAADERHQDRINAIQHAPMKGQERAEDTEFLVNIRTVAKLLDLSERTVWGMANSGRMPKPARLGRSVRWSYEELRTWVNAGCPPQNK